MILTPDAIESWAQKLDEAEQSRHTISQLSASAEGLTVADSYAVQRAWVDRKVARGRRVIGHKIGLTSRAMQLASGIDEPDFGILLDDMLHYGGARLAADAFLTPRLEVELAFYLKAPLQGPGVTLFDVLSATAWVAPALELIDARIELADPESGRRRTVIDTIADNAANAALIVGGQVKAPEAIDLPRVAATLHRNEVVEASGVAAAVLGHPALGIVWLANRLAEHGEGLAAGEIVLCGSFTAPVAARPGDSFFADYGDLGTIAVHFS